MKISWASGIIFAILGFLVISIATIIFSFNQDVNLVSDDYYEQEIIYQQQIDRINRTNELSEQLSIKVIDSVISLHFPSLFEGDSISGKITLYRPSDRNADLLIPISVDTTNHLYLSTDNLDRGLWKIKVSWFGNSNSYFDEKNIILK
jgi:hypothetical protein